MNDKPDKIWAWPEDVEDGFMAASHVEEPPTTEYNGGQTEYLLATPKRELASDLAVALRELTSHVEVTEDWMRSNGYDGTPDREALKYPRVVLAKLDEGE